ncbi:MAG: phosphate/phosphite/phosphonate ABC transporter substrate-binding protein, partial [Ignavibacteria bacterium]|nr:phosphate/phosphite/phosphonate ABC transporter substrate-binding protein [Ignavibacteria bacterium]
MKTIIKIIILILFLFSAQTTLCQTVTADTVHYRSGFSSRVFINVNQNDALALTKVLTENIVRETNLTVKSTTPHFYENFNEIENAILKEKDDLYILLSTDYLQLKNGHLIEPFVVAKRNSSVFNVYRLIVKKEGDIKSLEDLKGKKIIIGESREGDIAHHWLDKLLLKSNLEAKEEFFAGIKISEKSMPALLPVFFGTADACIVTDNLLSIAFEMNPQLENQLTSIEISKPL